MIQLDFRIRRTDVGDDLDVPRLLLGIAGDLSVLTHGRILYSEQEFPLVELAANVTRWLRRGPRVQEDFLFESMEAEEAPLLWIKRSGELWHLGAIHQNFAEPRAFSWEQVSDAFGAYADGLQRELAVVHGLDITTLLQGQV